MVRSRWFLRVEVADNARCLSLGQLIKIIREPQMVTVVDKLIDYSSSQDEELRDISGLGLWQ